MVGFPPGSSRISMLRPRECSFCSSMRITVTTEELTMVGAEAVRKANFDARDK